MSTSAIVDSNGVIQNVIVGTMPGTVPIPDGSQAGIGWTYHPDGTFLPPAADPEATP